MKIVLATHNNDKFAELTAILNDFPIILLSLNDFPEITEIVENGNSLKENALIKARVLRGFLDHGMSKNVEVQIIRVQPKTLRGNHVTRPGNRVAIVATIVVSLHDQF